MIVPFAGKSVDVREEGKGPAILLIHGYPFDGAMWSSVARRLSGRFRVLKPDLPGHGDNPVAPSASIGGSADFVEAVITSIVSPIGLAGFSMGGYVAFEVMKRRPPSVRALALVDTRAAADDETGKRKRNEAIATLKGEGMGAIAAGMLPRLLSSEGVTRKDLSDRVQRIMLRQKPEVIEADLVAMRDRSDSTALLPQLRMPTLVVSGDNDAIIPAAESEKMSQAIPGARFALIPGSGHLAPMESPAAVAQALGDFFEEALEPER